MSDHDMAELAARNLGRARMLEQIRGPIVDHLTRQGVAPSHVGLNRLLRDIADRVRQEESASAATDWPGDLARVDAAREW